MNNSAASKYFQDDRGPDLRRVHSEDRKTFEVDKMWEIHHEISRLILLGFKNTEIADRLGVSEAMISYTRNSKIVKDKLELMKGARDADIIDLSKEIREKAPKALKLLEEIVSGEPGTVGELASVSLRARTAESWLDRAGYPAQKAGVNMHLHQHFTAQDIEEMKRRVRESENVVDVKELEE